MKRDNRQILVNPHSRLEKVPVGALNLGEIGVQHNNVDDAALYVETVADSESAETVAKFITEKAIDAKIEDAVDTLQLEIDGINEAVGLPHEESGATPWGTGASVWDAIETVYAEMTAGTAAANTKVIANDNQDTDDFMTLTGHTDAATSSITYTIGLKGLHDAFDAINDTIDALDFSGVTNEGKPIVNVSQEDGLVSAEAGNIKAEYVEVNESGDTLDELLEQIMETIEANEVKSADGSIIVTTGANGTDLSVNIDEHSIVLNDNNELVADLKLSAITPSDTNVKEEYALINHVGEQLGESIKIYKDSSLYRVYLGHVDDTLVSDDDPTVVPGSGDTALCFIYEQADGTYELVAIDVESFLEESEFADGLQVENHVVSVKVDPASEEVVVDASGNTAPVLSVGPNGVKISNIQNALDVVADELEDKIEELKEELGDVSVSEGTSFENFVTLNITNNGSGATAITIDDSELKQTIDLLVDDIANETVAREEAIEALIGNSASTSADTSIMGVKEYVEQVVSDLDADAVQEVEFAAVADKDSSEYGSNAGATVVPMGSGEVGKKLVLDLSLLKIDCGEYD